MPYTDPDQQRAAVRRAVAKYKRTEHGKRWISERTKVKRLDGSTYRSFVGIDGEGGGSNEHGQQNYLLLRAGDMLLFEGNARLTTSECLSFLVALDPSPLYVSYFFDYDTTQILRDLPPDKIRELFARRSLDYRRPKEDGGKSSAILWQGFLIGWHPRKHLKVCRVNRSTLKKETPWITVHDVGTFFQMSFVKALTDWSIGTSEDRARIAEDKARRSSFVCMSAREIEYNRQECVFLAELMEAFRQVCLDVGVVPRAWEGPGYLASAMMTTHKVTKAKELELPDDLRRAANDAYYGGRFEVFKTGFIDGVVEYDICSAYPAAYLGLPCLRSTCHKWRHAFEAPAVTGGLYLALVRFSHMSDNPVICHLPHRLPSGTLRWQREGVGWYWSTELEAAIAAGTVIRDWKEVWHYDQPNGPCDHRPFEGWVRDVYQQRRVLGKSVRGYPLKLALNSIYGKCCQSIGAPPFANPVWGGLITADVRRRLIEAYSQVDPGRIVMLATDGFYCVGSDGITLPIGGELGDWEQGEEKTLFVVKPGMYAWEGGVKVKTRGVPRDKFLSCLGEMQATWRIWCSAYRQHEVLGMPWEAFEGVSPEWPSVRMPVTTFIGARMASHQGHPERAGMWKVGTAEHSFDPTTKRRPGSAHPTQDHVTTLAHLGSPSDVSTYYSKFKTIGGSAYRDEPAITSEVEEQANEATLLFEGLPDYEDTYIEDDNLIG